MGKKLGGSESRFLPQKCAKTRLHASAISKIFSSGDLLKATFYKKSVSTAKPATVSAGFCSFPNSVESSDAARPAFAFDFNSDADERSVATTDDSSMNVEQSHVDVSGFRSSAVGTEFRFDFDE
jgi:hypothetical protein